MKQTAPGTSEFNYPNYPVSNGYLTEKIRLQYIRSAISRKLLPENAHRIQQIIALEAPNEIGKPIQFWQLFSVLGTERIINIVRSFYQRVYADEPWFKSVFERVSGIDHHIGTQSAMWVDVMGGGLTYHGGEYRLNFHHTHNAIELLNDRGAQRWLELMVKTLNDASIDLTNDPRVRPALNTFLNYFMGKYAHDFRFSNSADFGALNPPMKRRLNFLNMSSDAIEALSIDELRDELIARGVDVSDYNDKRDYVNRALRF